MNFDKLILTVAILHLNINCVILHTKDSGVIKKWG